MNRKHLYQPGDEILIQVRSQVSTEPVKPLQVPTPVFTLSAAAPEKFSIEDTPLTPSKLVLLSAGRFEHLYAEQLRALIYNDQEKLDTNALLTITRLSDIVEQTNRPIKLMSQALRKKLPIVCKVLNQFYCENHAVIRGISDQLNGG